MKKKTHTRVVAYRQIAVGNLSTKITKRRSLYPWLLILSETYPKVVVPDITSSLKTVSYSIVIRSKFAKNLYIQVHTSIYGLQRVWNEFIEL